MTASVEEFLDVGNTRPTIPLLPPSSPYRITPEEDPDAADRYARDAAWEANRDKWDRPAVMLPDGSAEVGYRRASSYGGPLEGSAKLDAWKLRQVLRGAAQSKSLRLKVTRAELDLDCGDPERESKAKDALDDLAKEAMDLAGSSEKADIGTSIHDICERYDRGLPLGHVDDEWLPDVQAWERLIADFEVLSIERIVVQDEFKIGGKLDRVLRLRRSMVVRKARRKYKERPARPPIVLPAGTVVLGDQKTSQSMDFAGAKFGCQCFAYATGSPYNPITKQREPWGHETPSFEWGVILHTPSGQGVGSLHWVDLRQAAGAAVDAHTCYEWRNKWGRRLIDSVDVEQEQSILVDHFAALAATAESTDVLLELYGQARRSGCWTEDLAATFTVRKQELTA